MISDDELLNLLQPTYIHEEELEQQCLRYRDALYAFLEEYGPGSASIIRAPGRVNLIGEHTDYNRGYVMPTAIDRDIVIIGRRRSDNLVRVANVEPDRYHALAFYATKEIPSGPVGEWGNYIRGAAQRLARFVEEPINGMDMLVAGRQPHGTPVGAGLSSSTSLTVVSTIALAHANNLSVSGQELAELASQAEWYCGTRGGIMDHFASVLGRGGHALFLDCRPLGPGRYHTERIPLIAGNGLVVANTGVRHQNTRSEFNTRVFECRVGTYLLRRIYPEIQTLRDVSTECLNLSRSEIEALINDELPETVSGHELIHSGVVEAVAGDMPSSFKIENSREYQVRRRCRHVINENQRVLDSAAALKSGNIRQFGELMDSAHASLRDDYEVSIPEVEAMAEAAHASAGCIGARLTGAGWGGCVISMVKNADIPEFVAQVKDRYFTATGIKADMIVCNSARGAQILASEMEI